MRADNTGHLIAAAQQRSERTRRLAVAAIRRLDTAGKPVTFDAVAREAGISRSWLYAQTDLRTEIQRLRARHHASPSSRVTPERQRATDASLLRRLEAATERIRRLEHDNRELRDALAQTLGEQRTSAILGTTRPRDTPNRNRSKLIGPC